MGHPGAGQCSRNLKSGPGAASCLERQSSTPLKTFLLKDEMFLFSLFYKYYMFIMEKVKVYTKVQRRFLKNRWLCHTQI